MGLFNFIDKQFLSIIQWQDNETNKMQHKHLFSDDEIKNGSKLIVMPGQVALFIDNGVIANIFNEGNYELQTGNTPFISDLKGWRFKFEASTKHYIYYIATKDFISQKWGTPAPINIADVKYGNLPIRAFGSFAFRVAKPESLYRRITSTNEEYTSDQIKDQLKDFILNHFAEVVQEQEIPATEISRAYAKIRDGLKEKVAIEFNDYGLEMTQFAINNISFPDNIQKMIDARTSVNILGGMENYAQVEILETMKESANNQGMNAMNQMGMGFGIGTAMGNITNSNIAGAQTSKQGVFDEPRQPKKDENAKSDSKIICSKCNKEVPEGSKFCLECGTPIEKPKPELITCSNCKASIPAGSKFCLECGNPVKPKATVCSKCGMELIPGAKFCPDCGTKVN